MLKINYCHIGRGEIIGFSFNQIFHFVQHDNILSSNKISTNPQSETSASALNSDSIRRHYIRPSKNILPP